MLKYIGLSIVFLLPIVTANASYWTNSFTYDLINMVNNKITASKLDDVTNALQNTTFKIDNIEPMPTAYTRLGGYYNRPTITISDELVNLTFYLSEVSTLTMIDNQDKWSLCNVAYSNYVKTAYQSMMYDKIKSKAIQKITPIEKFGGACDGIAKYYPFTGELKTKRDLFARTALVFIYLHELGHVYYRHIPQVINPNDDENTVRVKNCKTRTNEKQADLFATHTLVSLGWYNAPFDPTVWVVMSTLGDDMESSGSSSIDHPTSLERMSYVMDETRKLLISTGGGVSDELSQAIDESKKIQDKINKILSNISNKNSKPIICSD